MKVLASLALSALLATAPVAAINLNLNGAAASSGSAPAQQFQAPGSNSASASINDNTAGYASSSAFPAAVINDELPAAQRNHFIPSENPGSDARPAYNLPASVPGYVVSSPLRVTFNPNPSGQKLPAESPFDWFTGIFNNKATFAQTPDVQAPAAYTPSAADFASAADAAASLSKQDDSAANNAAASHSINLNVNVNGAQQAQAQLAAPAGSSSFNVGSSKDSLDSSDASASQAQAAAPIVSSHTIYVHALPAQAAAAPAQAAPAQASGNLPEDFQSWNQFANTYINVPNNSEKYSAPSLDNVVNAKYYNNYPFNLNSVSGFLSGHLPARPYSNNFYGRDYAPYPGQWINKALNLPANDSAAAANAIRAATAVPLNANWQQVSIQDNASAAPSSSSTVINVGDAKAV